jgi:hypothetical protein
MDNFLQIINLVGGPALGLGAVVVSIFGLLRQGKRDKADSSVGKQEATTHEFDAMRQGFVDSMADLREQLKEQKEEARLDREEAKRKHDELAQRVATLETEKYEMLNHVKILEKLVPDPPGVPIRPAWH